MKTIEYDNILLYYYNSEIINNTVKRHIKNDGIFTLRQFLNCKKGDYSFIEDINELRNKEYHSKEYNDIKNKLPLFWIGAKSLSGYRRKSDITQSYNIFSIDIDYKDNTELFDENGIDVIKYDLWYEIPSCFCAMKSCGGSGLVLYLLLDNVTPRNEKQYFAYWKQTFNNAGINIDEQTKDILTRARYISYDSDILMKDEVEPFKLPETFIKEYRNTKKQEIENYEINSKADIKYLDNVRRYKYCYTLKKLFGKETAERITKEVYDLFYNGVSDKSEAYHHIEASCHNDTEYIDDNIYKELIVLGIIKDNIETDGNTLNIKLNENESGNEWMYDRKDDIINFLENGVNMIISPTGTGKTEFWNQLSKNDKKRICVVEPFTSVVDGKYDKNTTNIAAGIGKHIDDTSQYTATNYLKFTMAMEHNMNKYDYLVIDESHLIGTQDYRAESLIEFIKAVNKYIELYPDAIVILQTATLSNEDHMFDIKKNINIIKNQRKFVQIHYTTSKVCCKTDKNGYETYESNIIKTIMFYTKMYINEHRKVYIYWGSGGINNMKVIQECENNVEKLNFAIYHTRNKGNDDMNYINDNRMIGKYNGLMSSCYFSVGCDLNDADNAAIIIVGNNPYQEDEQVIGRFRKSKNIKVNIIIDTNVGIVKPNVDKLIELEISKANIINSTKEHRHNSLIKKYTADDMIYMKAFMQCSKYYFSDLNRKFNFYKDRNYNVVNILDLYFENNELKYDIKENTHDGIMPVVYLIDYKDETLKQVIQNRKSLINELKKDVLNELLYNNKYDVSLMFDAAKDKPTFLDWLEAIYMIQNHYNISKFIDEVSDGAILKMSKSKMNDLIRFKIKIEKNETDIVEKDLIERLFEIYDELEDKTLIEVYYIIFYCYWCMWYEKNNNFTYDMMKTKLNYPVFKEWKTCINNIVKVNPEIRNFILGYKSVDEIDTESPSYIFLKDVIEATNINNTKKVYEIFSNRYINQSYYKYFVESQIKFRFAKDKEEVSKSSGKLGNCRQIVIDDIVYESVTDAAKKLNLSRKAIYHRLKSNLN